MPANDVDSMPAPLGMATAAPPDDIPKTHAQYIKGFVPGRNGILELAPLLKRIERNYGITIYGTAVWSPPHGVGVRLLLIGTSTVYSLLLSSNVIADTAWKYDERADGPHSYIQLPASLTTVGSHGGDPTNGVYSAQFDTELILAIGGILYRYYVDTGGLGTEKFYTLGIPTPSVITIDSQATGGAMTPGATYSYEYTWEDELGRESSPSATATVTLSASNTEVQVSRGSTTLAVAGGAIYWNVYRLNPGATTYKFVAQIAIGTSFYVDTASDDTVNANDDAPDEGENDPPWYVNGPTAGVGTADMLCVWKNRLVLATSGSNRLEISNAGSPTQFSAIALPTNVDDGLQVLLTQRGQNNITGLANLGSLLAVFTHDTTLLLYGDDISDFTFRENLQRGCINPNSIQRCENEIYFLSDDGVYAIGYESGYAVEKKSVQVDNLFEGFEWTGNREEPTSVWRYQPFQTASAIMPYVNSFYSDNRYFLSYGNRTLCMDMRTGGWTDTGWGFIKTVSRYYVQQVDYSSALTGFALASAPETIFLTFGDPTTWATELYYYTNVDTPTDRDAPTTNTATITWRPVGPEPEILVRRKRVTLLSQHGETAAKRGEVIGTIQWSVDGHLLPESPIHAWIVSVRPGCLFEVQGPQVAGTVIFPIMTFTAKDISIQNNVTELVYLN